MDILSCLPNELPLLIVSLLDLSSEFSLRFVAKKLEQIVLVFHKYNTHNKIALVKDIVLNKYIDLFKWSDLSTYIFRSSDRYKIEFYAHAASTGSFEILKYICENDLNQIENNTHDSTPSFTQSATLRVDYNDDILDSAVRGGHLEIVKYLREIQGVNYGIFTCSGAAYNGHLEVLKYLRTEFNGSICSWNEHTFSSAATTGRIDVLEWLYENKCPYHKWSCVNAIRYNRFDSLKWLREHGCKWDGETVKAAAEYGHVEILKYLRTKFNEDGLYFDANRCMRLAIIGNHLNILKYLRAEGYELSTDLLDTVTDYTHVDIIEWLHENGC